MSETGQSGRTNMRVSQATQADIDRQFLEHGEGNNSGRAPTYAEQWGLTAAPPGEPMTTGPSVGQLEVEAAQAEARAANPTAAQGVPQQIIEETTTVDVPDDELINYQDDQLSAEQIARKYKLLYGRSENDKGTFRSKAEELEETLNAVIPQLNALKSQPQMSPQQYPSFDPNMLPQPQFQQSQPLDYFEGMNDEDLPDVKRLRKFQQDVYAAIPQVYQMAVQAASQQYNQVQMQMLEQRKQAAGLTPIEEYKLMARNPWLNSLPDGPQKIEAMLGVWQSNKSQTAAPTSTPVQTPSTEVARNVVRKVTYTEPAQPMTSNAELTQDAVQAKHDKEMAEAMAAPTIDAQGVTRAQKMRNVASKYGYQLGDNGMGVIAR